MNKTLGIISVLLLSTGALQAVPTASFSASRTSGVAPLAVLFDATATTSDQTTRPFHESQFEWDFGDPTAGPWPTDGTNKNRAIGGVSAHVFDAPGTYTVSLSVLDADGTTDTETVSITVQDPETVFSGPSGVTYYVSTAGSDSNNGLSESFPFQTPARAFSLIGPNVRILFRRGNVWTVAENFTIPTNGPGLVGAYGTGDKPRIIATLPGGAVFNVLGNDWRVVDISMEGQGAVTTEFSVAIGFGSNRGDIRDVLVYRNEVRSFYIGFGNAWSTNVNACFWVDNTILNSTLHGAYIGGNTIGIMGNRIDRAAESHVMRVWYARRFVISHNVLRDPSVDSGTGRHALKLHSDKDLSSDPVEWGVVDHNQFRGSTYVVAISPQDSGSDETVRDILFENNRLEADNLTQHFLHLVARDVTIRNNIVDMRSLAIYVTGFWIENYAVVSQPLGSIDIYNNVVSWGADRPSYTEFVFMFLADGISNVRAYNNIGWRESAGNGLDCLFRLESESALVNFTSDHNIRHNHSGTFANIGDAFYSLAAWRGLPQGNDANSIEGDPLFAGPSSGDLHLQAGSPAIDAGAAVRVYVDYDGGRRPFDGDNSGTGAIDIGAYEYGSSADDPPQPIIVASNAIDTYTLTVSSAHNGAYPGTTNNVAHGITLDQFITNSPVSIATGLRAVANGGSVSGNNYTQNNSTNITIPDLTNNAVLNWLWKTQALFNASNQTGTVSGAANGYYDLQTILNLTADPNVNYRFSRWTGDVPTGSVSNNPLSLIMDQARTIGAVFISETETLSTPTGVLASDGTYTSLVAVTWDTVAGAGAYEVWRNSANNAAGAVFLNNVSVANYTDASDAVRHGTLWYYWVRAVNTVTSSEFSVGDSGYAQVSATNAFITGQPLVGDYDGDGLADPALYDLSSGQLYVWLSLMGYARVAPMMSFRIAAGDLPVAGDFDGDRMTDPGVFQRDTGSWFIWLSAASYARMGPALVGLDANDIPVPSDFDGDGKTDPAVYHAADGSWTVWLSGFGYSKAGPITFHAGLTDIPAPGRYEGEALADPAVYQPETGDWYVWLAGAGYGRFGPFSFPTTDAHVMVSADYDGDGLCDPAAYIPATGTWRVWRSSSGYHLTEVEFR